jgi:hypothetical protein
MPNLMTLLLASACVASVAPVPVTSQSGGVSGVLPLRPFDYMERLIQAVGSDEAGGLRRIVFVRPPQSTDEVTPTDMSAVTSWISLAFAGGRVHADVEFTLTHAELTAVARLVPLGFSTAVIRPEGPNSAERVVRFRMSGSSTSELTVGRALRSMLDVTALVPSGQSVTVSTLVRTALGSRGVGPSTRYGVYGLRLSIGAEDAARGSAFLVFQFVSDNTVNMTGTVLVSESAAAAVVTDLVVDRFQVLSGPALAPSETSTPRWLRIRSEGTFADVMARVRRVFVE